MSDTQSVRGKRGESPQANRARWEERYKGGDLPWDNNRVVPFLARLVRTGVFQPPGPVLDLGCGPGNDARYLGKKGFDVTAVDLSAAALGIAATRLKRAGVLGRVRLVQANILELVRADVGAFMYGHDRGCFHCLAPRRRRLYPSVLHRLLRKGALFSLWTMGLDADREGGPYQIPAEEIRELFSTGFEVVSQIVSSGGSRSNEGGCPTCLCTLFRCS
ncbi:methyltransferase domain-containing protein [bacterium]|nr:methyltransferase domain-containing protein [bacterium]